MIFNFKDIVGKIRTGSWFKKERINSPDENTKTTVKNTTVEGDLVGRDKNEFNNVNITNLSNLEKKVLKVLHLNYSSKGLLPRAELTEIYKILEIQDGHYVGLLNDSKYLEIDGSHIKMTNEGIRYMDNLEPAVLSRIILPEEQRRWDQLMDIQSRRFEENRVKNKVNSAR